MKKIEIPEIRKEIVGKSSPMEWISSNLTNLAGLLSLIMIFAIMREVVGRYFFNNPSDWSLELSGYLLVGLVYLGAAGTEMNDGHVRIDFIYSHYGKKMKFLVDLLSFIIGLIWCSVLVWQGYLLCSHSFTTDARSATIMRWPLYPAQGAVVLGAALTGFVLLYKIFILIFNTKESEK